jgi:hypothetical protein
MHALELIHSFNRKYGNNSILVIPCSQYFWINDDFAVSLKETLHKQFGIEEKFCVAKPPIGVHDSVQIERFGFELVKRFFLAADKLFR